MSMAQITLPRGWWIGAFVQPVTGKTTMKEIEIRRAKDALVEKSILGYRKSADGPERTSGAKVGAVKTGPARLVKAADAKVGLPKIGA
jgi:hypothetical protein